MFDPSKALSAALYALFSVMGAGLASLWFQGQTLYCVLAVLIFAGLGALVGIVLAERSFPDHPVLAVWLLEFWVLAPGTLAAAAAALVIIVTVALAAPTTATESQKEIVKALSSAITVLIAALFLKAFEDADDDVIGERVKKAFRRHYLRFDPNTAGPKRSARFYAGSDAERWVYGDIDGIAGWSVAERHKRAKMLQSLLNTRAD